MCLVMFLAIVMSEQMLLKCVTMIVVHWEISIASLV